MVTALYLQGVLTEKAAFTVFFVVFRSDNQIITIK